MTLKRHFAQKTAIKDWVPVDWRQNGVVNEVQDQGHCGSCWAFSATSAIESIYAIKYTTLYKLSEQNLVDCSTSNNQCSGGWMDWAMDDLIKLQNGTQNLLKDYPNRAMDQACQFNATCAVSVISNYFWVDEGNETDLAAKDALYGPVSVAIDASHLSFQLYSSGIYNESACSTDDLDHAVVVVGYGISDQYEYGVGYWIVRNSWGSDWGEQGYIRMIRDLNNQCGIATHAIVPVAP